MFSRCAVLGCENSEIQIHHCKRLNRKTKHINSEGKTQILILNKEGKRTYGLAAIMSAINRKQLPLCPKHHTQFENGIFSSLDPEYIKSIHSINIPDGNKLRSVFDTGSYSSDPSTKKQE